MTLNNKSPEKPRRFTAAVQAKLLTQYCVARAWQEGLANRRNPCRAIKSRRTVDDHQDGADDPRRTAGRDHAIVTSPTATGGRRRRMGPNSECSTASDHSASNGGGNTSFNESALNLDSSAAVRASDTRAVIPWPRLSR